MMSRRGRARNSSSWGGQTDTDEEKVAFFSVSLHTPAPKHSDHRNMVHYHVIRVLLDKEQSDQLICQRCQAADEELRLEVRLCSKREKKKLDSRLTSINQFNDLK